MARKPSYEELEQTVKELEKEALERKRSEEGLKKSEHQLRLLTDNSPGYIAYVGADDLCYHFVNQKFEVAFDRPREEIVGKHIKEIIGESNYEFALKHIEEVRSGKPTSYENVFNLEQGKRWIKVNYVPDFGEQGKVKGIVVLSYDITERKLSEEALKESEGKLSTMLQSLGDHISMMDKDLNILWANDVAKGLFGDDIVGKKCHEVYHGRDKPCEPSPCLTLKAFEDGQVHKYETLVQTRDGRTLAYACTASVALRDDEGNPACVIEVSRDISERKQAEDALRRSSEKILEANKQRKLLSKKLINLLESDRREIAMGLHDHAGQMLTALKMDLERIGHQQKNADPQIKNLIDAAEGKAVQVLRDLKRIAYRLRPEILDTLGLVPSLSALFDEIKEHNGIKIDFFTQNVPGDVGKDKELALYRIAQEALTNIIKHARAKNIFVSLVKKGKSISLSVEDDGIGFEREEVMKLLGETAPLGLIFMEERVLQVDGKFRVESRPQGGTYLLAEVPV